MGGGRVGGWEGGRVSCGGVIGGRVERMSDASTSILNTSDHKNEFVYVCVCAHMCMCPHVDVCMCPHAHVPTCVCAHMCMCPHVYVPTCVCAHILHTCAACI